MLGGLIGYIDRTVLGYFSGYLLIFSDLLGSLLGGSIETLLSNDARRWKVLGILVDMHVGVYVDSQQLSLA